MGESANWQPQTSACSGNGGNETGDFECNICFELAQDPVVTLCGHLYCWPCLYKWLRVHSHSQECPVCKALIQEEKLVPLYGRGKTPTDPRSKHIPGVEIPNRPAGQRPETAPTREANTFPNLGFGLGFVPMATARVSNFAISGGFGGALFPSLFSIQVQGVTGAPVYGMRSGIPSGFSGGFHGARAHNIPREASEGRQVDNFLKNVLLLVGIFIILALCW